MEQEPGVWKERHSKIDEYKEKKEGKGKNQ